MTDGEKFNLEAARQLVIGEIPSRNARKSPDREALIFGDQRITWRQLDEVSNRLGNALLSRGVKQGDKVAILMRNRQEIIATYFAVAKLGAVSVPINFRLAPREIAHMIANSDSKIVILEGFFLETIGKIRNDLPLIERYIVLDGQGEKGDEGYADLLSQGT
ncbi:MAG: hypothetical protein CVU24_17335, partial [Betaproteobacteria bacterium HGW-Betaproteobacteria-18]